VRIALYPAAQLAYPAESPLPLSSAGQGHYSGCFAVLPPTEPRFAVYPRPPMQPLDLIDKYQRSQEQERMARLRIILFAI